MARRRSLPLTRGEAMATTDESTSRFELRSLAEQYARGRRPARRRRRVRRAVPPRRGDQHPRPERVDRAAGDPGRRAARPHPGVDQAIPEDVPHARAVDLRHRRRRGDGRGATASPTTSRPTQHGGTDYVMFIRYEDTYRPDTEGAWKFAHRRLRVDWTETRAVNPPSRVGGSAWTEPSPVSAPSSSAAGRASDSGRRGRSRATARSSRSRAAPSRSWSTPPPRSPKKDSRSRTSRATRSTARRCTPRSTPRPTTSAGCRSPSSCPGSAPSRRCCSSTTTTSARRSTPTCGRSTCS